MNNPLPALLLMLASSAQAYDFEALAKQHILPVYEHLAEQTAQLNHAVQSYCTQPGKAVPESLHSEFSDAFLAWQGAQHLRLGPIQYLSREHRFAMWPDKRGSVRKHLAKLKKDPDLQRDDFDISSKSVAVQGFSAMERLLHAQNPPNALDCRIIEAIAGNLQSMSDELVQDWQHGEETFASFFAKPGPINPIYESEEELAGQLLNSLYTQLELIVTQKLARPLGDTPEKARGKRAEGWRSGNGLRAIAANLGASEALYRYAFAPELSDKPLAGKIEQQFRKVNSTLSTIALPLSEAVSDTNARAQIEQLQQEVSTLKGMIGRDLASELDLSLGFNSLDGD